jgi:ornithine cyclodeaminase/alanine dehydrogenase-like protein (mu-crystallin family)
MIRYINEKEVAQILTMEKTVALVEQALRDRAEGRAVDTPRVRTSIPAGSLQMMQGAVPGMNLIGYKAYYSARGKGTRYFVHLFNAETREPTAIIEASHLGMVRTGAASGVAARYLARKNSAVVGMIGAGKQAIGQLEAVCVTCKIREVKVYSRTPERAQKFCDAMGAKLGVKIYPVASAADAVRGADIINVITKASEPVLEGAWLEPGQHINAAGGNSFSRRELDEAAVKRSYVVVDARGTARNESGDLLPLVKAGLLDWDKLPELGEVIAGSAPGRTSDQQITLYESHGMCIQDLYPAQHILEVAREKNIGIDLPI